MRFIQPLLICVLSLGAILPSSFAQSNYPNKPINFIVPAARKLNPALSKAPKPAPKKITKIDGHIVRIY